MSDVNVVDIKAFVPAEDFERSKAFYQALGFTKNFETDSVAEMQLGEFRFLLQNFYEETFVKNFMMQLMVTDLDAWWPSVESVAKEYGVQARAPEEQPWGQKILYLWDPAGVLWHIAESR